VHHTSRSRYLPASGQATLEEAQLNGELVLAAALDYAAAGLPVLPLSWNRTVIASCPACKLGRGCPGRDQCRCGVETCHGFWAATTDAERCRLSSDRWRRVPGVSEAPCRDRRRVGSRG